MGGQRIEAAKLFQEIEKVKPLWEKSLASYSFAYLIDKTPVSFRPLKSILRISIVYNISIVIINHILSRIAFSSSNFIFEDSFHPIFQNDLL